MYFGDVAYNLGLDMMRYKILRCVGNTDYAPPFAGHRPMAHGIYAALLGTSRAPLCSVACADAPMPFGANWQFIIPQNTRNYKYRIWRN